MKIALTDGGKGCNSFTHMYQNPNVLECKKNLYSKIAIQNFLKIHFSLKYTLIF